MGLIAPAALCYKIGGLNEGALVAYPLLLSLASVLLAFFAGRSLFNVRTGLLASTIMAVDSMR